MLYRIGLTLLFSLLLVQTFAKPAGKSGKANKKSNNSTISTKCDKQKVDKCSIDLVLVTNEKLVNNPPTTIPAVNKWCKTLKPIEDCVRDYAENCLTSEAKKTLSVALYAASRNNKRYCTNTKRKNEFIEIFKCMADDMKFVEKLFYDLTSEVNAIKNYKGETKLKIPMVCCTYYKYLNQALESVVEKKCPQLTSDVEKLLQGYTADLINLSCGEYTDDSDKCDTILPKVPKSSKQPEWKGIILPLAQIFEE